SRRPPEPDILCAIEERGPVAFELVDLIDESLARAVARAVRGKVEGVWYGKSRLEALREKCGKTYQTQHPIELVVCADEMDVELLEPPSPKFAGEAGVLLQQSPFQRIWVVKLTKAQNRVGLPGGRAGGAAGERAPRREVEAGAPPLPLRFCPRVVNVIVPTLKPLNRIAFLRNWLGGTMGGRPGAVYSRLDKKQFAEAFALAMDSVTYCQTRKRFDIEKMYWWAFMEAAARAATELGDSERDQVLARLDSAPEPGGVMEARCLETFSRWKWKSSDRDGAIEFARRTALADPTYAEGHLLLAWY